MTSGVLVVDKPDGLTSHDVVAAARRALGERRIGHCGTLDPMATGVLVLAVGTATRLVQYLSTETKEYDAVVRFGLETDTDDVTGRALHTSEVRPLADALAAGLTAFRGSYPQTPPRFSARKVDGVRAHALARRGDPAAAALPATTVTCHALALTGFDGERVSVRLSVSAGFYVRAFARDLGRALGTVATLEALRRTRSGTFAVGDALPFPVLVQDAAAARGHLVPVDALLPDVPAVPLGDADRTRVAHGGDVAVPAAWSSAPDLARLTDTSGKLLALAVPGKRAGFLHPAVVLG